MNIGSRYLYPRAKKKHNKPYCSAGTVATVQLCILIAKLNNNISRHNVINLRNIPTYFHQDGKVFFFFYF